MKTIEDLRSQPDLPDWMDYPQCQISFNGQQFLMTGLTSRDVMVRGPWGRNTFSELEMLENIMTRTRNTGCFIDVGANLGNHSVFFANFCGAKCLYSVEAHPLICQVLKFNCKQHIPSSCPHTIFNYAASNQRGVLGVKPILPKNVGGTRVCKTDKGEIEIESRTLDELVGDEKIAFIKADVEGHEAKVFQGARQIIQRDQPLIAAEAPKKQRRKAITAVLGPLGYKRNPRRFGLNYFWEKA